MSAGSYISPWSSVLQVDHSPQGDKQYVVTSVDNLGEVERWRPSAMSLSLNLSSLTSSTLSSLSTGRSPSIASIETPGCEEDTGKGCTCVWQNKLKKKRLIMFLGLHLGGLQLTMKLRA